MSEQYESLLRERITQLRLSKNISEHQMSLDLGKSGSYIRSISSGRALPSLRELFNIIEYFGKGDTFVLNDTKARVALQNHISALSDDDLEKVRLFIDWITAKQ